MADVDGHLGAILGGTVAAFLALGYEPSQIREMVDLTIQSAQQSANHPIPPEVTESWAAFMRNLLDPKRKGETSE
jgi:hypothetical protein